MTGYQPILLPIINHNLVVFAGLGKCILALIKRSMVLQKRFLFFLLHVVVKHRDHSRTFSSKFKVLIRMLLIACRYEQPLVMTDVLQILHFWRNGSVIV